MRFYGRVNELKKIKGLKKQYPDEGTFRMITARRRIGKTKLAQESCKGEKYIYLFV